MGSACSVHEEDYIMGQIFACTEEDYMHKAILEYTLRSIVWGQSVWYQSMYTLWSNVRDQSVNIKTKVDSCNYGTLGLVCTALRLTVGLNGTSQCTNYSRLYGTSLCMDGIRYTQYTCSIT